MNTPPNPAAIIAKLKACLCEMDELNAQVPAAHLDLAISTFAYSFNLDESSSESDQT